MVRSAIGQSYPKVAGSIHLSVHPLHFFCWGVYRLWTCYCSTFPSLQIILLCNYLHNVGPRIGYGVLNVTTWWVDSPRGRTHPGLPYTALVPVSRTWRVGYNIYVIMCHGTAHVWQALLSKGPLVYIHVCMIMSFYFKHVFCHLRAVDIHFFFLCHSSQVRVV